MPQLKINISHPPSPATPRLAPTTAPTPLSLTSTQPGHPHLQPRLLAAAGRAHRRASTTGPGSGLPPAPQAPNGPASPGRATNGQNAARRNSPPAPRPRHPLVRALPEVPGHEEPWEAPGPCAAPAPPRRRPRAGTRKEAAAAAPCPLRRRRAATRGAAERSPERGFRPAGQRWEAPNVPGGTGPVWGVCLGLGLRVGTVVEASGEGSDDFRAWKVLGGLFPAPSQFAGLPVYKLVPPASPSKLRVSARGKDGWTPDRRTAAGSSHGRASLVHQQPQPVRVPTKAGRTSVRGLSKMGELLAGPLCC